MKISKFRSKHWSNSKLAHWIYNKLGVPKPESATAEEWDDWNINVETNHKIIHWIVDDLFDYVQDILFFPSDLLDNVRIYIRNKYVLKTHIIQTGLKSGEWHEVDTKILEGCFLLLVDFVECQKANMYVWTMDDKDKPLWRRFSWLRWGQYRSKEDGIAYLKWEMSLVDDGIPSHQSMNAADVYQLYNWWTNIRPLRKDPYELSGWTKFEEQHPRDMSVFRLSSNRTPEEQAELNNIFKRVNIIEEQYNKEDDEMLTKLIQLRRSLWT
ncbi:MAG: hypothetical protein CTY12_06340 [Methylotenera sp.]|nr:MAG: hypothetical protein CTY12_06340 [Methylotenera sp.]